jgi:hypothetical protein
MVEQSYVPVSFWVHVSEGASMEFKVVHHACENENDARSALDSLMRFGVFVNTKSLPARDLMFGLQDKSDKVVPVPTSNIRGCLINPSNKVKVDKPFDVSTNAPKAKAYKHLLNSEYQ